MLKSTLILGLILTSSSMALASENTEIKGATRVAVLSRLAEKCDISVNPSMSKWVTAILSDFSPSRRQEFDSIADMVQTERVKEDGRVGSCYKLRVELFRDGWL